MRAMVVRQPGGLDKLEAATLPEPGQPGPGEIRVRIRASSLNFHDFLVVAGHIPTSDGRIPLSDGAGEVVAVGDGVTEFAPGDMVVSTFYPPWLDGTPRGEFADVPGDGRDGYGCEYAVMPATAFTRIPKDYSAAEAATLTCAGVTAWRALVPHGGLKAGDTVVVMGTGGVAIFALQLAKAMGATVIATSSSDEKLERAKALGADHLINYKSVEDWGKKAFDLAGGGVDHVIEIGGPGTLAQSIEAIRTGGHIALIGVLTGIQGEIPTAALMMKQTNLRGVMVGSRQDQLDLIAAVEANGIKPVVDRHFALESLGEAFQHQLSGQHFGKICVDI